MATYDVEYSTDATSLRMVDTELIVEADSPEAARELAKALLEASDEDCTGLRIGPARLA